MKCQRCNHNSDEARCPVCKYKKDRKYRTHNKICKCMKCKERRKLKPIRKVFGKGK